MQCLQNIIFAYPKLTVEFANVHFVQLRQESFDQKKPYKIPAVKI